MADDPILVLGATSLIGRFLLPRLAASGAPAMALSRAARASQDGIRWAVGDLARPSGLATIGPIGAVISLSPIWLLTAEALNALHQLGMRRLVAFSSTSRFTKSDAASARERAVAQALADGEALVEAFCRAHGVGFTILRPTLIYAEGQDGNVSRLAALIRRFGVLPLPGQGRGLRQPVHADDLAVLALVALAQPAGDRAYDTPGGETLTYRAMARRVFEGLGRKPRVLPLPQALVRAGYVLAKPMLPGATIGMVDRVNQDLVFDGEPVRRDFGWAPRGFHPRFVDPPSLAEVARRAGGG
jgi:nucleoside-diphosphate-sugar epimerase